MPTPTIHAVRRTFVASLWLGVLGAPLVWAAHLQLLYGLMLPVERGRSVAWLYATTAICFLLVMLCGSVAWRDLRSVPKSASGESDDPAGRTRFLALLGLSISILFGLTILATGAAVLFFKVSCK